jgi:hypothetical protein
MSKHNQELVVENNDLAGRTQRLIEFLNSEEAKTIKPLEFDLLVAQGNAMITYASILAIRVKLSQDTQEPGKVVSLVS